ncbi:MAG: prolipoprotein diacylglyceryl transferase [candidate division FCPU426 bacterium]
MLPILFSWGPFTLRSYGLMVATGFGLAIYLAWRRARQEGIDPERFLDMTLWVMIAGLAGARLLYVIVSWRDYAAAPLDALKFWQGGLVFYGGFICALLVMILYCRLRGLPLWKVLDLSAPYTALGHAVGRIGCFLNGCCYGPPNAACGVIFPALEDHTPRLPIQLFESAFLLLLFFGLLWLRRRRRFDGQMAWVYVFAYALGRFILEYFRGDEIRGLWTPLAFSTSQLISLAAMAAAAGFYLYLQRRALRATLPSL